MLSQTYSLKSLTAPQKAIGGEVFQSQPTVAVLDSLGQIALDYAGSCYVNVGDSPSGFEALYLGGCDYTECGTRILGTVASVPFVNGIATFSVSALVDYFIICYCLTDLYIVLHSPI